MCKHRWRFAFGLSLAIVAGAAWAVAQEKATITIADDDLAGWVSKRADDWKPQPGEKRFDEIGWVHNVLDAERLAKEHKRPIFLFTHDGRMNCGRC